MPPSSSSDDLLAATEESTTTVDPSPSNRLWPRTTTALLLLVGLVMGLVGFATVMSMGDMGWHGARDAELRATYQAYQETGTLLIKETGSGSYGVQAPAEGPLTFATWDDDPGSYIIASLMSNITGSDSPYPGLKIAQALLVAIPLVWLPLAVARIVGRARAGYALIVLPLVVWLFNHGATLVGTEYGLSDRVNTLPVYSLYGTAASLAFLSLSLLVLLSSYRLKLAGLITATVGISLLAAFGNMSRSLSGMGIAAAVGVLWWLFARGRWRWISALGGALVTVLLATVLQTGMMTAINVERANTTGQAMTEVPDAHTAWHSLYLGLSYPTPLNGEPSRFPVTWADEFGWAKAREVNPDVLVASEEYDEILKGLYLDEVLGDPVGAVKLYIQKAWYLAKHFGGLVLFIFIGFAVGFSVRSVRRPHLGRVLAISTPLFVLGLVPAILVMPMLYYYSELAATLGLLASVSLGVIAWALISWPSRVRSRAARRIPKERTDERRALSVVLDGTLVDEASVKAIAAAALDDDEILVATALDDERARPDGVRTIASGGEVGARLREAVLRTRGDRVVIIRNGTTLDAAAMIASARPAPGSAAEAADLQPRTVSRDLLRKLTIGEGITGREQVISIDGEIARNAALVSKESGEVWFDEMLVAASMNGAPGDQVVLSSGEEIDRRGAKTSLSILGGLLRVASRREEYASAVMR